MYIYILQKNIGEKNVLNKSTIMCIFILDHGLHMINIK